MSSRRWRLASTATALLVLLVALLQAPSARATTSVPQTITAFFLPVSAEHAAAQLVDDAPPAVPPWHGTDTQQPVTAAAELARLVEPPCADASPPRALPVDMARAPNHTQAKKRKKEEKIKTQPTNEIEAKLQRLEYTVEECQTLGNVKQRIHDERMMSYAERLSLQPRVTFKASGFSDRFEYVERLVASRGLFLLSTPEEIQTYSGKNDKCKVRVHNADKVSEIMVVVSSLRSGHSILETIDEQAEAFVNSIILQMTDDEKKTVFEQSKVQKLRKKDQGAVRTADNSVSAKLLRKQTRYEKTSEARMGHLQENAKEGAAIYLFLDLLQRSISEPGSFKYDNNSGVYSLTVHTTKDQFEFAPIFDGLESDVAIRHVNSPIEARRKRWIPMQIKSACNTLGKPSSYNFSHKLYENVYCVGIGMLNYETNNPATYDDLTTIGSTQIGEIWDIGDNVGTIGPTFGITYTLLAKHQRCFVSHTLLEKNAPGYLPVNPFLLQMLENIKAWEHTFSLDELYYDFSSGRINADVHPTHQIEKNGFKILSAFLPGLRPPWRQQETVDTVWRKLGMSNKTAKRNHAYGGTFHFDLKGHPNDHFADWILVMYKESKKVAVMDAAKVYGLNISTFNWNEVTGHNMHLVRIFDLDNPEEVEKLQTYLLTKKP